MFGKGGQIIVRGSKRDDGVTGRKARASTALPWGSREAALTAGDFMGRHQRGQRVTLPAGFLGLAAPTIPSLLPPPAPPWGSFRHSWVNA